MKLSSQSDGMTPFLTMSLARSATNLAPVPPDTFSISATIPEAPAALPVFILVIAFTTISTSICMGGQQQGQQSGPQDSKKTLHSEAAHSVVSSKERLPESSLTHLSPTTSWLFFLNCFAILKMSSIPGFRSENFFSSAVFFIFILFIYSLFTVGIT